MSALQKQTYASQFRPLFQPFGTGSGSTGPTGPSGPTGPTSGSTGPTGPSGPTGPVSTITGPTGPQGATGDLPSQILQYALPSGTPGGAASSALVYLTRPINEGVPALTGGGNSTVISGMNLTANQFTLPAGTYAISGAVCGLMTVIKSRLYDVTNSQVVALGLSVGCETRNGFSPFYAEFTITTPTVYEVQFCGADNFGANPQCWGQACGFGDDEIYLQVLITKEA